MNKFLSISFYENKPSSNSGEKSEFQILKPLKQFFGLKIKKKESLL